MTISVIFFVVLSVVFLSMAVKEGKKSNVMRMKKLIKLSIVTAAISVFAVLIGIVAMAANDAGLVVGGLTDVAFAYISAAIAVSVTAIGAGNAVAVSAAAAIGAVSENEKISGKALIFVAMGEGIALYGVLIAFMILSKVG